MKTREEINWNDENIEREEFGGATKLFWENPAWFENEMRDLGWQHGVPRGVEKWVDANGNDITEEILPIYNAGLTLQRELSVGNLNSVVRNAYARLAKGEMKEEYEAWRSKRIEEEKAAGNEYPYPYIGWQDTFRRRCYEEWGEATFTDGVEIEERDFSGSLYRSNISEFVKHRNIVREGKETFDLNEDFPGVAMAKFDTWQEYLSA